MAAQHHKADHETSRTRTEELSAHCSEELKMYMNTILTDVLDYSIRR